MKRSSLLQILAGAAVALIALMPANIKAQQGGRELFERARILEESNQNLPEAIRLYTQAAAQAKTDRALAATAHFRIGACYEKLGNAEARKADAQRMN